MDTAEHERRYRAEFVDETFQAKDETFTDRTITAAQVLERAGKHPRDEFYVLRHMPSGELETLRETETVELEQHIAARFFIIRGSMTYRFFVNGLNMEWPRATITGRGILFLAREGDHDEILLERAGEADQVVEEDQGAALDGDGVERFRTRRGNHSTTLIVNARERTVAGRTITFDALLLLAFNPLPTGENILWTVSFAKGPPQNRDGEMFPGQTVRIKDRMVFNVSYTDKS